MSCKRFSLAAVVATACIALTVAPAKADCDCIDNLAHELMPQVRQLEREYVANFRGAPQFTHGLDDVREVAALATHFHETAHDGGSPQHLRDDVEKLERAFHHLESVIAHMEHELGHSHGMHNLREFRSVMANVGATIHQLKDLIVRGCGWGAPSRGPGGGPWPDGGDGWSGAPAPIAPPQRTGWFGNGFFGFRFRL